MIKKKLSDNSGASLLIALLFFMICAVIGSMIITISMAASGRMQNLKDNQQSYYTVYSAVKLLTQEITENKYSKYKYQIVNTSDNTSNVPESTYQEEPTGQLKELLKKAADTIFQSVESNPNITYQDTLTISLSSNLEGLTISPVTVQFQMDAQYEISLRVFDTEEPSVVYEVSIPAIFLQNQTKSIVIIDKKEYMRSTTTLRWGKAAISKK